MIVENKGFHTFVLNYSVYKSYIILLLLYTVFITRLFGVTTKRLQTINTYTYEFIGNVLTLLIQHGC